MILARVINEFLELDGEDYNVIKISNILTQSDDFSFGIEPSANGSKKLVEIIMSNY